MISPLPVCGSLQNGLSIAAAFCLAVREAHSPLSGTVFQWTTRDCLNFVFGHVVTVDVSVSTSGIIAIGPRRRSILPWPQGKKHPAGERAIRAGRFSGVTAQ